MDKEKQQQVKMQEWVVRFDGKIKHTEKLVSLKSNQNDNKNKEFNK